MRCIQWITLLFDEDLITTNFKSLLHLSVRTLLSYQWWVQLYIINKCCELNDDRPKHYYAYNNKMSTQLNSTEILIWKLRPIYNTFIFNVDSTFAHNKLCNKNKNQNVCPQQRHVYIHPYIQHVYILLGCIIWKEIKKKKIPDRYRKSSLYL